MDRLPKWADVVLVPLISLLLAAGISASTFDAAMRGVEFNPKVVERDRNQNEFTKTIWDYLDKAVSDDRIAAGQKALKQHGPLLDQIEARYGADRRFTAQEQADLTERYNALTQILTNGGYADGNGDYGNDDFRAENVAEGQAAFVSRVNAAVSALLLLISLIVIWYMRRIKYHL